MNKLTLSLLVPSLVFVLLAACSDDDKSGSASSPSEACAAYVSAKQARFERCRDSDSVVRAAEYPNYCAALLSSPGFALTPAKLGTCAAALRDAPCDRSEDELAECDQKNTVGSLADGTACASSYQCASSYCKGGDVENDDLDCGRCEARIPEGGACTEANQEQCALGTACFQAKCVAIATVNEGEACGTAMKRCAEGLHCASSGGTDPSICKKAIEQGGACDGTSATRCRGELECISNTCQIKGGEGAPCEGSECGSGFSCYQKKCTAITKVAEGQPCGGTSPSDPPKRCGDNLFCSRAEDGATRVCKPYKAKGAACIVETDECAPYTVCLNNVCVLVDPNICK